MLITISNNHSHQIQNQPQKNIIILGVHNFTFFLSSFSRKKNISILLQGNSIQLIQNVLWNEFYTHTLLKDINKMLNNSQSNSNTYLKINNTKYRLCQYLEWQHANNIKHQLLKYPTFHIESFTQQGQIRLFTIQLTQTKSTKIDLIFQYKPQHPNTSHRAISIQKNNKTNLSYLSKTNSQSQSSNKNQIASKSLFEIYKPKQKQHNNTKYLTEKKRNQTAIKKNYKCEQNQNRKSSQIKNNKSNKIINCINQNNNIEQKQLNTINNIHLMNKTQKTHINEQNNTMKKQELIATLLSKKQQKLKQYKQTIQQKQKFFQQKLSNIELSHQQQVITIKKQVQNILNAYKYKNKQLRKQNKSLLQTNSKLQSSNIKLQQNISLIKQNMKILQDKQIKLQQNNHQYLLKLDHVQKNNTTLNQQINQQMLNYQLENNQKDKQIYQIKMKYERLLNSLKFATETQKQNIF